MSDFAAYRARYQTRVNQALETQFNQLPTNAPRLNEAMRYSLFASGKRIRPILCYASTEAVGGATESPLVDACACALECIHTYSLIHDDLPAMDDDDLRRGAATCHIAFDEATAILAGDALQTAAFQHLADAPGPAKIKLQIISELAKAAGSEGMIAGQMIDLAAVAQHLDLQQLETMHRYKTGALIRASVLIGAIATGQATAEQLTALDQYAQAIGLAFQVQDDILDVVGDTQTLGKHAGADAELNKPTYVSLMGLESAKRFAKELHQQALAALSSFDHGADPLRELSAYIVDRVS